MSTPQSTQKRPNILWVSFEDTNPFYGCYGDTVARTPVLDQLAADGTRYTRCFSTAGVCAPARAAIITGMYSPSIGTQHMRTSHTHPNMPELPTPYSAVVPHYVKCFSEYLRAAGYYCTNNVKTDYQFLPPVTAWDELSTDAHWRNRPEPDQPFFAVFNPTRTHESGMWSGRSTEEGPDITFDPDAIQLPPYFPDTPKVRKSMARMYTNIERSDQELGQLLQQLEDDGLAENTIVMHWSDHGPLPRGKRWPYDSGIRMPLIVRGRRNAKDGRVEDGIDAGVVNEELVSTVDLGPTVLSLAGVPIPQHMQGQPFLGSQAKPPREYIYAYRDRHDEAYDMVRAVRDKRFKYMRNFHTDQPYLPYIPYHNTHPIVQEMWRLHLAGELSEVQSVMFGDRPAEELYDTEADPFEINNLATDPVAASTYAAELTRLRTELETWMNDIGDLGLVPEAEMVRGWYPNGEQPQTSPPHFVPFATDVHGQEISNEGATLTSPAALQLHCATQGASLTYTLDEGEDARWQLYTKPFRLEEGTNNVRAKATRIGYKESGEVEARFEVI